MPLCLNLIAGDMVKIGDDYLLVKKVAGKQLKMVFFVRPDIEITRIDAETKKVKLNEKSKKEKYKISRSNRSEIWPSNNYRNSQGTL